MVFIFISYKFHLLLIFIFLALRPLSSIPSKESAEVTNYYFEYVAPVSPEDISKSLRFANAKESYKSRLHDAISKFQKHKSDTGSASAQSKYISIFYNFSFNSNFFYVFFTSCWYD